MADNDIFERALPPCFHKSYKVAKGTGTPLEFARSWPPALAKFLRQIEGFPSFDEFCDLITPVCSGHSEQPSLNFWDYTTLVERSEEIARSYAGTEIAKIAQFASDSCRSIALEAQVCGTLPRAAPQILTQRFCEKIIQSLLLDPLNESKVLERFMVETRGDKIEAFDRLAEWKREAEECLGQALEPIACQLADDPSGQKVSARAVRHPQRSTAELTGLTIA